MEKKEKVLAAADPGCGRVPVIRSFLSAQWMVPETGLQFFCRAATLTAVTVTIRRPGTSAGIAGAVWENARKEPCLRMKTAKYGSVRKNAVAAIPVSMSVPLAAVPGSA